MAAWQRFREAGGLWVLAQVGVLLLVFGLPWAFPAPAPPPVGWVGILLSSAGIFQFLAGCIALGRNLTPLPKPKDEGTLVIAGIYRWVRHPLYGGIVLMALGSALRSPSLWTLPLPLLALAFFDRKATAEERFLVDKFSEYEKYRRGTKKLIAGVY